MTDERIAYVVGPCVAVVSFAVTLGLIVWRIRVAERRTP